MSTYSQPDSIETLCSHLNYITVDRLKELIRVLNDLASLRLKLSGKKSELTERLAAVLRSYHSDAGIGEKVYKAFRTATRFPGTSIAAEVHGIAANPPTPAAAATTSNMPNYPTPPTYPTYGSAYRQNGVIPGPATAGNPAPYQGYRPTPHTNAYASTSTFARTNSHGTPSHLNQMPTARPAGATLGSQAATSLPINFKSSPFYRIDRAVSSITVAPRAAQNERKTVTCHFTIPNEVRELLEKSRNDPKAPLYELRVFATTDDHYNPQQPMNTNRAPALIEFPYACEVKCNECVMPTNVKGIKKKAGTAPPGNLSKTMSFGRYALDLRQGARNRIDMAYVNTEKRHFLIVYLVEATTVAELVERVKKGKFKSKEDVVRQVLALQEDDDVQTTSSSLSLRDPTYFVRIAVPTRASTCTHVQCFDAECYLRLMESTPTWLCPVCHQVIAFDDFIVDKYVEEILTQAPDDEDGVVLEADVTWHTADNKYGNSAIVAETKTRQPIPTPKPSGSNLAKVEPNDSLDVDGDIKGKGRSTEITILDDSDEDGDVPVLPKTRPIMPLPRQTQGSVASSRAASTGTTDSATARIIDLTMSSDDDEPPRRPGPSISQTAKRGYPGYDDGRSSSRPRYG